MPALREQDFDKMAAHVVDQFLSGRAKLADAAAAQATSAGLNPDQIERLTQAANTMTFLRMMEDRKAQGEGDLTHEFDPIDARQVIRIVIDHAGVHVDPEPDGLAPAPCGSDAYELPDEMSATREPSGPAPPSRSEAEDDAPDEVKARRSAKEAELRTLRTRKLAAVLDDQLRQAEWAFEDVYATLAARFRRAHSDVTYASFEKDALAEHPDEWSVQVLNLLRHDLRLPPLSPGAALEKVAGLRHHHVSDDTPELGLFERLLNVARDAHDLRRGLARLGASCA